MGDGRLQLVPQRGLGRRLSGALRQRHLGWRLSSARTVDTPSVLATVGVLALATMGVLACGVPPYFLLPLFFFVEFHFQRLKMMIASMRGTVRSVCAKIYSKLPTWHA